MGSFGYAAHRYLPHNSLDGVAGSPVASSSLGRGVPTHVRKRKRLVRLAAMPAVAAAVLALGVGPAHAEESAADGPVLQHYLQDTLATNTRPAALVQGKSADRVRRFLDEAARNGRLVDLAQVLVTTVTDAHAGQIDLVWDDGATPQYVGVEDRPPGAASMCSATTSPCYDVRAQARLIR